MREIIWLLIVLLAVYVGYQLYRVSRLGAKPRTPPEYSASTLDDDDLFVFERPAPVPPHITTVHAGERQEAVEVDTSDLPLFAEQLTPESRPLTEPVQTEAGAANAFEQTLELHQLRRDVDALRDELTLQRAETQRLQETVHSLREQLDGALVSQGISPEYNEALVFARRGLDVSEIAERCDISVAEAELVRSLAQSARRSEGDPT